MQKFSASNYFICLGLVLGGYKDVFDKIKGKQSRI